MGPKAKTILSSLLRDPQALNELRNALELTASNTQQTTSASTTPSNEPRLNR